MKLLLLFGLSALAVANIRIPSRQWLEEVVPERYSREIRDSTFRSGREYKFVYDGQLATGIPGSSQQHSAIRMQSVCVLQFESSEMVTMKMTHIRIGKLNSRLPNPKKMIPFTACEEVHIDQELLRKLTAPVQFNYNKGMISQVRFDESEVPWSANIKRGVMNMLQVNLQKQNKIDTVEINEFSNDMDVTRNNKFESYGVLEKTLEGECDTYYTMTSQPCRRCDLNTPVLNVTKSINFEKCKRRPHIKYNYRFQELCPSCEKKFNDEEKVLKSTTVSRYNITGDSSKFMIESCKVDSHYTVVPYDEQENVVATYVKQKLHLVKTGPIETQIRQLTNPIESDTNMIYTPDWDIYKERFFMQGDEEFGRVTPYSEIENKVQFFKGILTKLCNYIQREVEQEAPRQFARMVKFMRMLKREELEEIHEKFYTNTPSDFTPEDQKKIKDMLVDGIAMCGTVHCVEHLVEKIKQRQIHPIRGALAIKKLVEIRTVSERMINKMMELGEHEVCKRNPFLKQSVWLTCGSMINAMCAPNEDKLAREFKQSQMVNNKMCPRELKEKYVQILFRKFKDADTTNKKVLYLKSISNCGLDLSVFELEKIISNTGSNSPYSTLIRKQAVQALRKLVSQMPRKIQRICLPIILNKYENTDMRIMCFYTMMQTQPSRPILDQITKKMVHERSRQLVSFVYTTMMTLANSTDPCEQRIAQDLKLSLRLGERVPFSQLYYMSRYIQKRWYSREDNIGMGLDFAVLMSNTTYLPKHLSTSLHANILGQWSKYLLTLGLEQVGGEKWLYDFLFENRDTLTDLEQIVQNPRDIYNNVGKRELKSLLQKLKITSRRGLQQTSDPFVMAYMKYKNMEYGYVPLSPELLNNFFGDFDQRQFMDYLRSGYQMKYYMGTFLHEMSRKIPTSMGIPIRFSFTIPTVAKLTGEIRTTDNKLMLNLRPSMATTMVAKIEAWCPIVNSGLKVLKQAKVYCPIECDMEFDRDNRGTLKLTYKPQDQKYDLLKITTRPVTYTRQWPKTLTQWEEPKEKTIVREEWNRVQKFDEDFGEKSLGVNFRLHGYWHRIPFKSVPGTPCSTLSGPNKLRLTVEPGYQMPEKVVVKMSGDFWRSVEDVDSMTPSFESFYKSQMERDYFDTEDDYESYYNSKLDNLPEIFKSKSTNPVKKMSQFYKSYSAKKPMKTSLKVDIETQGSSIKRRCTIESQLKCGQKMRYCQFLMNVERTPIPERESEPWKFLLKSETLYPDTPYTISDVLGKKVICNVEAKWGPSSQPERRFCNVRIQGQHSKKHMDLILNNKKYRMCLSTNMREECKRMFSPVSQYEDILKASSLNKFKIDVDYDLPVWMINATNKLYRTLKHKYFWQTDVNQINVRNPEKKIRCSLTLDPTSFQYLNVTVKTPEETCRIMDIPLPIPVRPMNIKRHSSPVKSLPEMWTSLSSEYSMPMCKVNSERIETFDGVRYRVPFTDCYSVLAKDCSDEPRFAVLIKKRSGSTEQKKLKIVTESHKIVINKRENVEDRFQVTVNGDEYTPTELEPIVENGRVVLRCEKVGSYLKITLPVAGIKVYFDGYAANIKMSRKYQNVQCGLCGHFDNEPDNEFLSADMNDLFDDLKGFHRSYLHTDDTNENCQVDDSVFNNMDNYKYKWDDFDREQQRDSFYRMNNYVDYDQDRDSQESDNQEIDFGYLLNDNVEQRPIDRTKVIEHGHELCFSKVPVPKCPRHTYPLTYEQPKKVVYCCLPRDDPQAEVYYRQSRRHRVVQEVSDLPSSFTETELIPESCTTY
jgi:hypothetical protein